MPQFRPGTYSHLWGFGLIPQCFSLTALDSVSTLETLSFRQLPSYSGEIISLSGVLSTQRAVAEIQFELPRRVESLKQCAAWIVWNLDQHSSGGAFRSARDVGWINEGRQNRRLLPWVMSQAEFDARPQCTVRRDWLRLALKNLREQLASLPEDGIVVFSFDGSVFSIRCDNKVIAFPGEGLPRGVCFKVRAGELRRLPKRLMHDHIALSIWQSRLAIDGSACKGTIEPSGLTNRANVQ
jgi:hypothetical protein